MTDFSAELSLLWSLCLNGLVFGSAWWFAARRTARCRSQALLDGALLGYAVQYVSVGGPGMLGVLRPTVVAAMAVALCLALLVAALTAPPVDPTLPLGPARRGAVAVALFAATFILGYAFEQADLPVLSNDALTYHFPAPVQWLQHGRIDLYPTWFFNPANTYSPLAGSTFIAWLIAPMGNDVLARFVEVPMLGCVGLATYPLCRQLAVAPLTAACAAAATVLCWPIFAQSMMAKDDLFVVFCTIAIIVALDREQLQQRWGGQRLGLALGLLLATKYTVLLTCPVLLLAVDVRRGQRPRVRVLLRAIAVAAVLAGPWYLRNTIATGNPLFPLDLSVAGLHVLHGQFTPAVSDGLRPLWSAARVLLVNSYALPPALAILLAGGWVGAVAQVRTRALTDPLFRTCLLGPVLGLTIFVWRSPFPEIRFVLPCFALLFVCSAVAVEQLGRSGRWAAWLPLGLSVATLFPRNAWLVALAFTVIGSALAASYWFMPERPLRRLPVPRRVLLVGAPVAGLALYAFVFWHAYVTRCFEQRYDDRSVWGLQYAEQPLWRFVEGAVPADATVAYTGTYLTYPLQGSGLHRQLVYVPTRAQVQQLRDLPWLGSHLSGERLVPAAVAATIRDPQQAEWMTKLRSSGAAFLVVGTNTAVPESAFAASDPAHFQLLFRGGGGSVYAIQWR